MRNMLARWSDILTRIETTHTPRPEGDNIVTLPNGLQNLHKAIEHLQRERRHAEEQRADILAAMDVAEREFAAAVDKNAVWIRDTDTRLYRLRKEVVIVVSALGIVADVPTPPGVVFQSQQQEDET